MKSSYLQTLKRNSFAEQLKTLAKEGALVASTALLARSNGGIFSTLSTRLLDRLALIDGAKLLDTRLPRLGLIAHGSTTYKELNQARQAQR